LKQESIEIPLFLEKKAADNCFFGKTSPKKEGKTTRVYDEKNRVDGLYFQNDEKFFLSLCELI